MKHLDAIASLILALSLAALAVFVWKYGPGWVRQENECSEAITKTYRHTRP